LLISISDFLIYGAFLIYIPHFIGLKHIYSGQTRTTLRFTTDVDNLTHVSSCSLAAKFATLGSQIGFLFVIKLASLGSQFGFLLIEYLAFLGSQVCFLKLYK
jgi:hypothetical protein